MHQVQSHGWVQAGRVRDEPIGTSRRAIGVRRQADERLNQAGRFGCVDLHALAADKRADAVALAAVAVVRIGVGWFFVIRLVGGQRVDTRLLVIIESRFAVIALDVADGRGLRVMATLVMCMMRATSKQRMDRKQTGHQWRDEADHSGSEAHKRNRVT